jgi:hypothetical protein
MAPTPNQPFMQTILIFVFFLKSHTLFRDFLSIKLLKVISQLLFIGIINCGNTAKILFGFLYINSSVP